MYRSVTHRIYLFIARKTTVNGNSFMRPYCARLQIANFVLEIRMEAESYQKFANSSFSWGIRKIEFKCSKNMYTIDCPIGIIFVFLHSDLASDV